MLVLVLRTERPSSVPQSSDDPLERLPREIHLRAILQAFNSSGVEYVVGGMAAVLHGAEVSTVDLDVVIEQSRANRDRAIDALEMIGAERITYTPNVAERITYTPNVTGPGEPLPETATASSSPSSPSARATATSTCSVRPW